MNSGSHRTIIVRNLIKNISTGNMTFNNEVQRNFVWDVQRKSLLIASLLEGYAVPEFYVNVHGDGKQDVIDGKQRSMTIKDFVDNKFKLVGFEYIVFNGIKESVSKKLFSDLTAEMQEAILDYEVRLVLLDSLTQEQVREYVRRLNNGKMFTSVELNRIKALGAEKILELGQHHIFTKYMLSKEMARYANESNVMKTWGLLYAPEAGFQAAKFRKVLQNVPWTDLQVTTIKESFDFLESVFDWIIQEGRKTATVKSRRAIISVILKPTHFSMVAFLCSKFKDTSSAEKMGEWILAFFNVKKSNNKEYNSLVLSGVAKASSLNERKNLIISDFSSFKEGK